MNLEQKIEAILFWKGEPISYKKLATLLGVKETEIKEAVLTLKESLKGRGIVLVEKDEEITLGTAPEISELLETLTKEELVKDLGKAGLETLSIILYRGPVKRSDIDYVRGVNSSFILRNLLVRGLIERNMEGRGYTYKPTFELMSYLGIKNINELPEYDKVREEINAFEQSVNEEEQKEAN